MATTHPWNVVGRDHTGPVERVFHATSGRQAELDAKAAGIQVKRVDPVHTTFTSDSEPQRANSVLDASDWSRLECAITKGVFRGIIWVWIFSIIISIIVAILAVIIAGANSK